MLFHVGEYRVERISKHGLWLVSHENPIDLGQLFLRAQEFFESPNPGFVGSQFTVAEYVKWYSENVSEEKTFSYFDDFQGYNVPGEVVDKFLETPILDMNPHDLLFARIAQAVKVAQNGPYYIVGARLSKAALYEHELAHGMWALRPEYHKEAAALVAALPIKVREEMEQALAKEGYSEAVMEDELHAYLATGLLTSLEDYEHLREPFMRLFYKHRRKFLDKKSKKTKTQVIGTWPFPEAVPSHNPRG